MKEALTFAIAVFITAIVSVLAFMNYKMQEVEAMKSNIESAIVKGIDPIAVKCAYGYSDAVCVAYATRRSNTVDATPAKK